MSDIDRQIQARTAAFVSDLYRLVRQSALAAVEQILGGSAPGAARGRASAPELTVSGKTGQKRPPAEIARTTERVLGYVKANPGQGVEAMGKALQLGTREVSLPIKKLLAQGLIRVTGHKRATKYLPGEGGGAAKGAARRSRKK